MKNVQYVVEMKNITKTFPGIVANDKVSFRVEKGEIHSLLGENGAGKSTLMNILYGLYQAEEGQIYINGKEVKITDPNIANELGIGMVHQHFMLVQNFTVTENIILGCEPRNKLKIDYNLARKQVVELSNKYGLKVDPDAKIEDISVGMQQRVEILKTLYRGAEIIIFDEPTAVLIPQEIEELVEIMRNLVNEGKSIILITHKLKEIMTIANTVTIIRRGKVIDSIPVSDTNPDELAEKMVGREVSFAVSKIPAVPKEIVLKVEDVKAKNNRGLEALRGISFEVRAGEILGIAGVDGNGQTELIEVITGLRKTDKGNIYLKGKNITNSSIRAISEYGLSHIPEDRHKRGLILDFSIGENMVLETYFHEEFRTFKRLGFINYNKINSFAKRLIKEFDVRTPSVNTLAKSLSGGNQQKAVVAREVDKNPDLLIAAQPTRGLDVGAVEFIHKRIVEQRDKGKAVLLLSLELDEIISVSDRIAVIYEGKIVGIVDPKSTTEKELGKMMAGALILEVVKDNE